MEASQNELTSEPQGTAERDTTHIIFWRHAPLKREFAYQMRRSMTGPEQKLWSVLRASRLDGLHFRRQQIIDGFVADFYCHSAGLIVEADGGLHDPDYDAWRDKIIQARNLLVLRFPNEQIEIDLPSVVETVRTIAHSRTPQ